jgi:hypothetical protein
LIFSYKSLFFYWLIAGGKIAAQPSLQNLKRTECT